MQSNFKNIVPHHSSLLITIFWETLTIPSLSYIIVLKFYHQTHQTMCNNYRKLNKNRKNVITTEWVGFFTAWKCAHSIAASYGYQLGIQLSIKPFCLSCLLCNVECVASTAPSKLLNPLKLVHPHYWYECGSIWVVASHKCLSWVTRGFNLVLSPLPPFCPLEVCYNFETKIKIALFTILMLSTSSTRPLLTTIINSGILFCLSQGYMITVIWCTIFFFFSIYIEKIYTIYIFNFGLAVFVLFFFSFF